MRNWLFVAVLGMAVSGYGATTPAEDVAEFQAALASNLKDAGGFLADPMAKAFAFSTGSQTFSPVKAKGVPHFNLGVGLGVNTTVIDKSGVKAAAKQGGADLTAFAAGLPDSLPIPMASINAHVGLPGFLIFDSTDIGLRFAGLTVANADTNVKINSGGLEFRGNVFEEGLVSPVTLTLGLGIDQLKTEIHSLGQAQSLSNSYGGYTRTGTVQYGFDLDSSTLATALKVDVSRSFLFFRPYAGVAFQVMSGDTTVTGYQTGTITSSGPGGGPYSSSARVEGKGTRSAPGMEVRLAGGFEFSFVFFYIALGGEYGVISGGAGGNGQIGLQF